MKRINYYTIAGTNTIRVQFVHRVHDCYMDFEYSDSLAYAIDCIKSVRGEVQDLHDLATRSLTRRIEGGAGQLADLAALVDASAEGVVELDAMTKWLNNLKESTAYRISAIQGMQLFDAYELTQ